MPGRRQRGFTLIEMMVVVAIIAIMAALSLSALAKMTGRANAVSFADQVYNAFADARALAVSKNAPVLVLVDLDMTSDPSGHGGIYEILDLGREFQPSQMSGWSTAYGMSTGKDPISANTSIWTQGKAQLRKAVRFNSEGVAGHIAIPTSAQITDFATRNGAGLLASPWPIPSTTPVTDSNSGAGCSFCNGSLGYVWVRSDGSAYLSNPNDLTKLQTLGNKGYLMFATPIDQLVHRAIYVATPSGLTHAQES